MKFNKSMLVAGVVTTVAAGSLLGVSAASADSTGDSGLIDKIATKFNVNKDEVEAVFEEQKNERQAERDVEISARLQEAVDAGKISAEQKTLIEEKLASMKAERESSKESLEAWATENNIDAKYVMGGRGHKGDSSKLDDLVKSGDITEAQKTLIEQKRAEMKSSREQKREELKNWAEENNIPLESLDILKPRGGDRHSKTSNVN